MLKYWRHWFKLWYVFDYREADTYKFRAPGFVTYLYVRYHKQPFIDTWYELDGL